MRLANTRFLGMLSAAVLAAGCASPQPVVRPKILNSYAPPGSPQAPPLDSSKSRPVEVPTAPVNPRVPAVQIVPEATTVVPVQPQQGPPAAQLVPVPGPKAELSPPIPTNSQERDRDQQRDPNGGYPPLQGTNPPNSNRDQR